MAGKRGGMREVILEAAITAIATDGVAASTAGIAKQAGVAQGSIFHHFKTKDLLLNAVFGQLKGELDDAVLAGLPRCEDVKEELGVAWSRWIDWGVSNPVRRRALHALNVSDVVTSESRTGVEERLARGIELFHRASNAGAFKGQPIEFIGAASDALAQTTIEMMTRDPAKAQSYRDCGFEALWNMLR